MLKGNHRLRQMITCQEGSSRLSVNLFETIYPQGKPHNAETLLCVCLRTSCNFLVIFLGWVMLPHPQATSTDHGGPRSSDLSIEKQRRKHFTTAPTSSQMQQMYRDNSSLFLETAVPLGNT